jgi:hypothetical protein
MATVLRGAGPGEARGVALVSVSATAEAFVAEFQIELPGSFDDPRACTKFGEE